MFLVVYDVSDYHKVELQIALVFFCTDASKHRFELQRWRTKDMWFNSYMNV